jgi:hypothetical protein
VRIIRVFLFLKSSQLKKLMEVRRYNLNMSLGSACFIDEAFFVIKNKTSGLGTPKLSDYRDLQIIR